MNADGTGRRRLGASTSDRRPVWSPDGRRLALVSGDIGSGRLVVVDAGSGERRELAGGAAINWPPSWSPDGARIAYTRTSGSYDVAVVGADGAGDRVVSGGPTFDAAPAWSPDGSQLAFLHSTEAGPAVHVVSPDGGPARRISQTGFYGAGAYGAPPSWSPGRHADRLHRDHPHGVLQAGRGRIHRCLRRRRGGPARAPAHGGNPAEQQVAGLVARRPPHRVRVAAGWRRLPDERRRHLRHAGRHAAVEHTGLAAVAARGAGAAHPLRRPRAQRPQRTRLRCAPRRGDVPPDDPQPRNRAGHQHPPHCGTPGRRRIHRGNRPVRCRRRRWSRATSARSRWARPPRSTSSRAAIRFGTVRSQAVVSADEPDGDRSNNTALLSVEVLPCGIVGHLRQR